jgi:thymidylate kinase
MAPDNADAQATVPRPFLITFSGIDGAGKTTQIEQLALCLEKQGLRVLRLSFWDHVAVWSKLRAEVGHRSLDSRDADSTAPNSFSARNNKHVRKWYLTAARSGMYLLDVARLRRLLAGEEIKKHDVIIFDRFIYDQFANISSQSLAARIYGKILLQLAPVPDLAFVLDASPAAAFARKPEYPLAFVFKNRLSFLHLRELIPQLIIIPDGCREEVANAISFHIDHSRLTAGISAEPHTDLGVVSLQNSPRVQNDPTAAL